MKTKVLLIAICALALSACNNEPQVVLGEDAVPAVAMNVLGKPFVEVDDYLVNLNYADNSYRINENSEVLGPRVYYRPKEIINLLRHIEIVQNASYERVEFWMDNNDIPYQVDCMQQFDSPKMALANYRAWVGFVDQLMTDSDMWGASISMYHSLDLNDTATTIFYYEGPKAEEYIQADEKMGMVCGTREDFDKAFNSLTINQLFDITVDIEKNGIVMCYTCYGTFTHKLSFYPGKGRIYEATADENRSIRFSVHITD